MMGVVRGLISSLSAWWSRTNKKNTNTTNQRCRERDCAVGLPVWIVDAVRVREPTPRVVQLCQSFQLVDHAGDDVEPTLPELGRSHVNARFVQDLGRTL